MKHATIILVGLLLLTQTVSAKKEVVSFDLKFGFLKGGEAQFIISDTTFNNQPAVLYNVAGRTTGLMDKLFEVNDVYETFVDAKTRLPLKSIRQVKEQNYRWYNETLYFPDIDSIYSRRSGWRSVPDTLVDIISVFFYFINNHLMDDIENGKIVVLPTFHADKISDVTIKYSGDRLVETDLGKINCHVLSPEIDKGKLLKRSDGLRFFISKKTKVPILLEFDMRVGTLRAVLRSYTIDGVEQSTRE